MNCSMATSQDSHLIHLQVENTFSKIWDCLKLTRHWYIDINLKPLNVVLVSLSIKLDNKIPSLTINTALENIFFQQVYSREKKKRKVTFNRTPMLHKTSLGEMILKNNTS